MVTRVRSGAWIAAWAWLVTAVACGGEDKPPPAPEPAAEPPAEPTPPPEPEGPNPCDRPAPIKLALNAGVTSETPWGLEMTYTIGEKNKAGQPTYEFTMRHGQRRWRTTRSWGNWNTEDTWRGFCWRGADRPEERAPTVHLDIAPVCEGGKLVEMGGCKGALP